MPFVPRRGKIRGAVATGKGYAVAVLRLRFDATSRKRINAEKGLRKVAAYRITLYADSEPLYRSVDGERSEEAQEGHYTVQYYAVPLDGEYRLDDVQRLLKAYG